MPPAEYVLWGEHPLYADGQRIKITGGTLRECTSAHHQRSPEGWTYLAVLPKGK